MDMIQRVSTEEQANLEPKLCACSVILSRHVLYLDCSISASLPLKLFNMFVQYVATFSNFLGNCFEHYSVSAGFFLFFSFA